MDKATDSKENHATECLAACLLFSSVIRREFIRFLCRNHSLAPLTNAQVEKVSITTQERIDNRYFLDLVLQKEGHFTIVVEVKVGSGEDGDQLRRYKKWLKGRTENKHEKGLLFSLVRDPSPQFKAEIYGADGRHTWFELYRWLDALHQRKLTATDANLITTFCGYLGNEGIVMPYKIKDLTKFASAIRTAQAIRAVFGRVEQLLKKEGKTFDIKSDFGLEPDAWPSIHIGKAVWKKKFGGGCVRKANIWFTVPGIWGADQHGFLCDIDLWNVNHESDWVVVQPKLKRWFRTNGNWDVYQENWDNPSNIKPSEIKKRPCRIVVTCPWRHKRLERQEVWSSMSEEKLASCLVEQAEQMISRIDKLPA